MIVKLLVIILSSYAVLYLIFSIIIAIGEKRIKPREIPGDLPLVSVIVCARNEEKNIGRCCESLHHLDYPKDKLEILLVDDESNDKTMSIMRVYAEKDSVFRILSTKGEPRDLPAKQRPLALGIRSSKGEILLITDADIAVKPGWIKAHLSAYDSHIGIVGGATRIDRSSGKLFDSLQCCDLITKHAVAMGCAGLGFPLSIMGNNISFRRDAYDMVGGFRNMGVSVVEDMALMNEIVHRTHYTLGWVAKKEGIVTSVPENDFTTFVNQRLRWIYELSNLSVIGKVMIAIETLMMCAWYLSLCIIPWSVIPIVLISFLWIVGYYITLSLSPHKEKGDSWFIPGMIIFQMIYSIVIVWRKLSGQRSIEWKGRVFERTGTEKGRG